MEATDVLGSIYQIFGGIGLFAVVAFILFRIWRNDGFKNLVAAYNALAEDRENLTERLAARDARLDALEEDARSLHQQLDSQTKWRRIAVRHIRDLRDFIGSRLANEPIPPLPAGLDLDD